MTGWSAEDLLAYLEGDCVSEYRPSGRRQDMGILDLPIEYTMATPCVGEPEPAYPLVVEPASQGAVEI
eukprot:7996881-Lingulodinium_polyedra.AAC.1